MESDFQFESIESSAVANSQVLANLVPSDRRLGWAKGNLSDRRFGWPNTQVLAYLLVPNLAQANYHLAGQFAAEKSLPEKFPEVIADARPHLEIDPIIVVVNPFDCTWGNFFTPSPIIVGQIESSAVANSQVLANLVPSYRRKRENAFPFGSSRSFVAP